MPTALARIITYVTYLHRSAGIRDECVWKMGEISFSFNFADRTISSRWKDPSRTWKPTSMGDNMDFSFSLKSCMCDALPFMSMKFGERYDDIVHHHIYISYLLIACSKVASEIAYPVAAHEFEGYRYRIQYIFVSIRNKYIYYI